MKVIYLDIDGVMMLPTDQPDTILSNIAGIPQYRADLLKGLLARTKSVLVISSQRRISDDVLLLLKDAGLTKYLAQGDCWKTPFIQNPDDDKSVRGQEIQAHIDQWGVKKHLIIDDMPVLGHHKAILIDPDTGLDSQHIITALKVWSSQKKGK